MIQILVRKLMGILLSLTAVFRRLLCFLGRRRRNSGMLLPMTAPTDGSGSFTQSVPSVSEPFVMESWDDWGDGKASVGNGPAARYDRRGMPTEESEAEPDYFTDMTPELRKPTRIILKNRNETEANARMDKLNADLTYQDPTLGAWEEGENAWEEASTDDLLGEAELALRETRRQDRERRLAEHQRKKVDKDFQRHQSKDRRLGVRLS